MSTDLKNHCEWVFSVHGDSEALCGGVDTRHSHNAPPPMTPLKKEIWVRIGGPTESQCWSASATPSPWKMIPVKQWHIIIKMTCTIFLKEECVTTVFFKLWYQPQFHHVKICRVRYGLFCEKDGRPLNTTSLWLRHRAHPLLAIPSCVVRYVGDFETPHLHTAIIETSW
jgi:hypothetical protein